MRIISLFTSIVLLNILSTREIAANLCSAGSWSDSDDDDASSCLPCASGHYCPPETVLGRGTVLKACPSGTSLPYTGASSINECSKCDLGTYAAGEGYTGCHKCPRGTYCDAIGLIAPKSCSPGTYQPAVGTTSSSACLPCPFGTFQTQAGAYECYRCPDAYTCADPAQTPIPVGDNIPSVTVNSLPVPTVVPTQIPSKNCFHRVKN